MSDPCWLVSYPKSGNTWMRALLQQYIDGPSNPLDLNRLGGGGFVRSRAAFDAWCGACSSDMTVDEIALLLPAYFKHLASNDLRYPFVKAHGACLTNGDGQLVFGPPESTRAVVLVRHPGDVAVSSTHHYGLDLDGVLDLMATQDIVIGGWRKRLDSLLPERVGSWSQHVMSWLEAPCHHIVVRYESLRADTAGELERVLRFLEIPSEKARVESAVEMCRLERLQHLEREHGFVERSVHAARFFRRGEAGEWQRCFTPAQRSRLRDDHGLVMERLGYSV